MILSRRWFLSQKLRLSECCSIRVISVTAQSNGERSWCCWSWTAIPIIVLRVHNWHQLSLKFADQSSCSSLLSHLNHLCDHPCSIYPRPVRWLLNPVTIPSQKSMFEMTIFRQWFHVNGSLSHLQVLERSYISHHDHVSIYAWHWYAITANGYCAINELNCSFDGMRIEMDKTRSDVRIRDSMRTGMPRFSWFTVFISREVCCLW